VLKTTIGWQSLRLLVIQLVFAKCRASSVPACKIIEASTEANKWQNVQASKCQSCVQSASLQRTFLTLLLLVQLAPVPAPKLSKTLSPPMTDSSRSTGESTNESADRIRQRTCANQAPQRWLLCRRMCVHARRTSCEPLHPREPQSARLTTACSLMTGHNPCRIASSVTRHQR
jgi:hypothetical protein